MKFTFKTEIIPLLIIIVSVALGGYFYSVFPDSVPVHWGVDGTPDRYGSKFEGAWLMPFIAIGMYLLFRFLPYIDPKKDKYQQFARVYFIFRLIIMLMMLFIYLVASFNSLGYNVRVEVWIPMAVGILFLIMGNYMGKLKPNWFMGIRTPWTLESDEVWSKTHRLGGKLFILLGILMIATPFLPYTNIFATLVVPVIVISLIPVVYSYIIYRKLGK